MNAVAAGTAGAKKRQAAAADKENKPAKAPKRTTPRSGAASKGPGTGSPMVQSAGKAGPNAVKPKGQTESNDAPQRDALIGRCIKKDFETDSGVKAFTGWIIGLHSNKKW